MLKWKKYPDEIPEEDRLIIWVFHNYEGAPEIGNDVFSSKYQWSMDYWIYEAELIDTSPINKE